MDYMHPGAEFAQKYPLTYAKPIVCGFFAPVEWLDVLRELSAKIEARLTEVPDENFSVDQVKEKFGGLRFYVNTQDECIHKYIEEAEAKVNEIERNLRGQVK
jgi:hypothetical protein